MLDTHGVHHIELDAGDVVFWHSSMWHYSPPNKSNKSRIAVAGVWTNPQIVEKSTHFFQGLRWVMKKGEVCAIFPPEPVQLENSDSDPSKPFRIAKEY